MIPLTTSASCSTMSDAEDVGKIVERKDDGMAKKTKKVNQKMQARIEAPVILTPAAMGPAPTGLASTGDPRMNAPWTALGTPAVSIPMPVGAALPLGLQLSAERGGEARVLRTAVRLQNMLGGRPL